MRRKGKALIIEDHPDWQERLQDHLEEGGFKVKVANTFEQAIETIHNVKKLRSSQTV